ncbi:hypothetical protein Q7P37_002636 [Cladosporium fusiforme]
MQATAKLKGLCAMCEAPSRPDDLVNKHLGSYKSSEARYRIGGTASYGSPELGGCGMRPHAPISISPYAITLGMAVNGGDIVSGLRLALQIYDYGFNEENAADVRYKNFQNDIGNFRYLLKKLQEALSEAQQRYNARPRVARIHAYDPLSEEFEKERKTIIGNFNETLNACDRLLAENKDYRRKYSNVYQNLLWHMSQQERRVDDLRTRLHFHSEKIRLVMDRLSINLLTDIDSKVDDLLAISEQNLHVSKEIHRELVRFRSTLFGHLSGRSVSLSAEIENSHQVSEMISSKFQRYLLTDAPTSTGVGIPMIQGFDALFLSFEQSINSSDCTPESYLSFLKARWLLEYLEGSTEFRDARPGFYYKRAVNQISQALTIRMQQPGVLISYDESVLMDLPDTHYRIWPPSVPLPAIQQSEPHPLMVRANEEEVIRMTLDPIGTNESDTVTLFKSSEERFRIVRQTTLPSSPDEKVLISQQVYIKEDELIPRYALPTINSDDLDLAIFSRNEETLFKFDTYENLFRFQTALTGYEVSHDQPGITCQFSKSVRDLDCTGRVQLWQEPITFGDTQAVPGAQHSPSVPSTLSDGTHSRYDSLAATAITSNTIRWTSGGWEAESIKLPAVTIFTELTDPKQVKRFAILLLELNPGTYVDPKECGCCRGYDTCSKLVITKNGAKSGGKKTGIPVRALFSNVDYAGHSGFDLLPFRTPSYTRSSELTPLETDYLVLKFSRLADKRRFDEELRLRFKVRDKQIQNQHDFVTRMRKLETQRPLHHTPNRGHVQLPADTPSVVSLPPQINMPSNDTRLDTSFIRGIGSSDDNSSSRDASLHASPRNDSTRNSTPDFEKEAPIVSRSSPLRPVARSESRPDPPRPAIDAVSPLPAQSTAASHPQRGAERRSRFSVSSAQTVQQTLQTDVPTERNRQGSHRSFFRNFKF